jgi:hypothetical protein
MKLHLRDKGKKNSNNISKNTKKKTIKKIQKKESYIVGLMNTNTQEEKYDKIFEQKLALQYKEFKNIKDYKLQSIKFIRIMIILATIIILALLLITYS